MGYGITAFRTDYRALRGFFGKRNQEELRAVLRQRKAIRELNSSFAGEIAEGEAVPVEQAVRELSDHRVVKNPTGMHAYGVQLVALRYGAALASGIWERISVDFFSHFDDLLTEHCRLEGNDRLHRALACGLDFAMRYQSGFPEWGHHPPGKIKMLAKRLQRVSFAADRDQYQQVALVAFKRWVRTAAGRDQALFLYYD